MTRSAPPSPRTLVLWLVVVCALSLGAASCTSCKGKDTAPTPAASAASSSSTASGDAGAEKSFGAFCRTDVDCASGTCFHKRKKDSDAGRETRDGAPGPVEESGYCSLRCDADKDCPSPPTSGRCGARGMCKRPRGE